MDFANKHNRFIPKDQNPTSHRIIEKRRRDRMNNCLADLSRLIPPDYLKKGRGRIEKTEIIEMATRYIKCLQDKSTEPQETKLKNQFRLGYKECLSEVMQFLTESQVHYPADSLCVQLVNHLEHHSGKLSGDYSMKLHPNPGSNSSSCGSSANYTQHTTSNAQQSKYHDSDTKDRQHSHYNMYTGHSEATPYNSMTDIEHSQQDENSEENTLEPLQKKFPSQTVSLMTNSFTMKIHDSTQKGGETTRSNYMRNILSLENGNVYRLPQDMILNANYPVMSPEYRQPYAIQQMHEPSLRSIRKVDSSQPSDSGLSINEAADVDNIHSYKFKNTIKQRFSQSQSTDYSSSSPSDGVMKMGSLSPDNPSPVRREQFLNNAKFMHKRRKISDHHNRHTKTHYYQTSSSGTNSSIPTKVKTSIYRCNNITQQSEVKEDTKSENKQGLVPVEKKYAQKVEDHNKFCENFTNGAFPSTGVPVFALHAKGSFYVPLNIDYDCLIPFLGPYNLLEAASLHPNISLHPVTISVNFQPT